MKNNIDSDKDANAMTSVTSRVRSQGQKELHKASRDTLQFFLLLLFYTFCITLHRLQPSLLHGAINRYVIYRVRRWPVTCYQDRGRWTVSVGDDKVTDK